MILQKGNQTLLVFQRYNKFRSNPKTICKSKLTNNIKMLISFSSQVY